MGSAAAAVLEEGESTAMPADMGIIPRALCELFERVLALKAARGAGCRVSVRVGFLEVYQEEVFDLLSLDTRDAQSSSLSIREEAGGIISVVGATEEAVDSVQEALGLLARGSCLRVTGETRMNQTSSRSHAIFTVMVQVQYDAAAPDYVGKPAHRSTTGKLHFVDLAGSERAKRTGADGTRLKEGININMGLLALGNVINALGDPKRSNTSSHVPYRDSKLTRMLQDSLGGNSRTVMICCISPADTNFEETLNALK